MINISVNLYEPSSKGTDFIKISSINNLKGTNPCIAASRSNDNGGD